MCIRDSFYYARILLLRKLAAADFTNQLIYNPTHFTAPFPEWGCGKPGCTVGCDCDRYMEVWNIVFSQFNNDGEGHYTELVQKNIDTGMGLERLAVVCQDVGSLFDVDTVMNITHKVK